MLHTSSTRFCNEKGKNDDQKKQDPKKGPADINSAWFYAYVSSAMFLLMVLIYKSFYDTPNDEDVGDVGMFGKIKWKDFVNDLLAKGEVEQIMVLPDINVVHIYLYPGAVVRGHTQTFAPRIYRMEISSVAHFENNLRKAESDLGIPANKRVQVVYRRPDASSYLFLYALVGLSLYMLYKFGRGQSRFRGINFQDVFAGVRKAKFRVVDPSVDKELSKIKFKDVLGLHEAKVEIKEFVDYLKIPENYTKLGAKLPKGALLLGPPGCGKTLLAKALSSEANVPFLATNGTEFIEMIGGLGAARVRDLFKEAKRRAPCIIYIDEIDAIGRKRGGGAGGMGTSNDEGEHTLNQLLVEMDGMDSAKGVVVLASTNRADILDKALLRPGRFDRHINIDYPTMIERKEIFEYYLGKIKLDKPVNHYAFNLAHSTPGFSGADIANVCNEAAIRAATAMSEVVTENDVNQALDRILSGPEKKSTQISPLERDIVAYHQSGQALVGWLLKYTDALLKVTIVPRTTALLGFAQYQPQDRKLYSQEELFDRMCMFLGGRAAENIVFKRFTDGFQNDLRKVTKIAYDQVKNYGMNEVVGPLSFAPSANSENSYSKPYSKKLGAVIDQEANKLVMKAYQKTEELLRANREKLDLLAKALLKKETITYEDMKELLGQPPFGEKRTIQSVDLELPSAIEEEISSAPPTGSRSSENDEDDERH